MARTYEQLRNSALSADSWKCATAGQCMARHLTDAQRWRLWVDTMKKFDEVKPINVVKGWLRAFHEEDPLHHHTGDTMLWQSTQDYPELEDIFRKLGLKTAYGAIIVEEPARGPSFHEVLQGERAAAGYKIGRAKTVRRLKVVVGEPDEAPPKNLTTNPPNALFVDFILFAKKPIVVVHTHDGRERKLHVGEMLRGWLNQGLNLGQVVEMLEDVG